ncbi:MAG: regulatory protein GemA [Rhizobiaceae bacterium]|nr:regulatory protein GemA [Rhizobiaceae bacterium]
MSAIAAIHAGLRQLGIDQDDARDLYERQTGKRSLREMSARQQQAIVDELRRLGFQKASRHGSKPLQGPFAKKLQAQWIALWNLGVVADRTDAALLAFVKRQTGIDHVNFLRDPAEARKVIDGLKGWMAREGGVEWGWSHGYDFLKHDAGKVAWAQFRKILPGATLIGNKLDFARAVEAIVGDHPAGLGSLTPAEWRAVMNNFGERIRKAKAVA